MLTTLRNWLIAARQAEPDVIAWADHIATVEDDGTLYWADGHVMGTWSARCNYRLAARVAAARATFPRPRGTLSWE